MNQSLKTLSLIGIIGCALFVIIMGGFDFTSGQNPAMRFGSDYVYEPQGWLMNLAFYSWAIGMACLAFALTKIGLPHRTRAGGILLVIVIIGISGSGYFNGPAPDAIELTLENSLHGLFGMFIFIPIIVAMFVYARRFKRAGVHTGPYKYITVGPWVTLILFMAFMFLFIYYLDLPGVGQRLFLLSLFFWLILVGRGIYTGDLVSNKTKRD